MSIETLQRGFILHGEDITTLKSISKILSPLEDICEHLSGEKYVTASCIIPICAEIMTQSDEDSPLEKLIKEPIITTLQDRYYLKQEVNLLLHKIAFCDPRFKGDYLEDMKLEVLENLKTELSNIPVIVRTRGRYHSSK